MIWTAVTFYSALSKSNYDQPNFITEEEKEEGNITLVKFTSKLGNSIVHPEHWTTNDKGDAFSVAAPNGQAIINVLTFAVEGTGELSDLQGMMVDYVKGEWIKSGWTEIEIGGIFDLIHCILLLGCI